MRLFSALLGILFEGLMENDEGRINYYLICFKEFDHYLAKKDAARFSVKLEELMVREFHLTIQIMISQGIQEAEKFLVFGICFLSPVFSPVRV